MSMNEFHDAPNRRNIKQSHMDKLFNALVFLVLGISFIAVLYPLIYIISSSFSSPNAVLTGKVWLWPVNPSLTSYATVFKNRQIITGYANSFYYAGAGSLLATTLTLMAAYPLSCKYFYGRRVFMGICLFTMLFSGGLIPTYILLRDLNILNTRLAIILPNAVAIWLVIITRTFMENIPGELHEAAAIDGCSDFYYFIRMIIPLSTPIIAVVALNYAVNLWNGYYDALIYLSDQRKYPLQIILRDILILNRMDINSLADIQQAAQRQGLAVSLKYSLIVVASAPLLIIYPFLQKYFVKGVMVGSIKG